MAYEPEVVKISGWIQNVTDLAIFACFLNSSMCVLIDLKIGTHIDWTYTMYIAKKIKCQISKSRQGYIGLAMCC